MASKRKKFTHTYWGVTCHYCDIEAINSCVKCNRNICYGHAQSYSEYDSEYGVNTYYGSICRPEKEKEHNVS